MAGKPAGQGVPRLFGTNGIRGVANEYLTTEFALSVGKAFGTAIKAGRFAVGTDTRLSRHMLMSSLVAGIMSCGKSVTGLGTLPTPALQYYCRMNKIPGVIITASHNPPQFNGIKGIDKDGTELPREKEESIERLVHSGDYDVAGWDEVGTYTPYDGAIEDYVSAVASQVNAAAIKKRRLKVLVDPGEGAAYQSTEMLLERLGCDVTSINNKPTGLFKPRNPEPKPENLKELISLMKSGRYDLGIAHDGDADRASFVDENGEWIDGDRLLALVFKSVLKPGDTAVTPVSSSDASDDVCKKIGAKLVRTKVGSPTVTRTMIDTGAVIGGEENGGIIYPRHQYCRDGAMTAALVVQMLAESKGKFSDLVDEVPNYVIVRSSIETKRPWERVWPRVYRAFEKTMRVDRTPGLRLADGLKLYDIDGNWVLIRASGTEPIIRIFAEARTKEDAEKLSKTFVNYVKYLNEH